MNESMSERLAAQIREALGEWNDPEVPVVSLVYLLRDELAQQCLIVAQGGEREAKLRAEADVYKARLERAENRLDVGFHIWRALTERVEQLEEKVVNLGGEV